MADEQVNNGDLLVWALGDNENTVRDLATYNSGTGVTTVANHRVFSTYGELLSQTNPGTGGAATVGCLFAYTGRALDQATGLQNNLNRWYDSITGKWLSENPIGFEGGDANSYRYCGNGPTNRIAPSGLQSTGSSAATQDVAAQANPQDETSSDLFPATPTPGTQVDEPPFFIPMFPPIQVPQNFNQPQHVLGDGYYSWMNANPGKWVTQSFNLGLSQFTGGSNNYSFLPNFTNPAQFSYQAGPFYVHGSFSPSGGMPPIKAIIGDFQHPSNFFNYQQFISGFNFRLQLMYGTGQSSSTAASSSTSPCDNIENTLNLIPGPGPK